MGSTVKYKSQQGAALLIFMLILVTAASYTLVRKLNAATKPYIRAQDTSRVLAEAKQALISYAVTYPDRINSNFGPGYLPCPDRDNNGIVGTGSPGGGACSSGGNTTIGRFPWVTLKSNELKDSSGQHLWYVLSDNYRNNPKLEPLNSETEGQLRIDIDADGDIDVADIDDVVAIIIAPLEPINNQNRDPSETNIALEINNYLEADNSDFDTDFVVSNLGNINDRLVYITRQELMEQVEKRVLGEVNQTLSNYFATYGAYPWLSSFSDPKTNEKRLINTHDGIDDQSGSAAEPLTDSSANFLQWGVANGDVVWNLTDGSYGTVTNVTATEITIGGGLNFGTDNDFDNNDGYFIDVTAAATAFTGTATAGSANLVLNDSSKDFSKLNVRVGDIVENITGGSSGIIEEVSSTQLTVKTLTGGVNTFNVGDSYQIRTSMGRATADTDANGLTLEDTSVDFTVMGIQVGDLIRNVTDDSYGRISSVAATRLTVSELLFGTDNTFAQNDYYAMPRFNSDSNARQGHLGLSEIAEPFKSELNFDWTTTANALDIVVTNSSILQNYIDTYAAAGSESFDDSVGTCIWLSANFVDCFASYKDFVNISGNLSSGSDTDIITDSSAEFNTDNVKRGDIAQNYDDETSVITGTVDAGKSGTATADTDANSLTLEDTNNNFINVNISIGATILNTTDNSSGTITSVLANQITVSSLTGGTDNSFEVGDTYTINGDPRLYDASADFSIYERYSYVIQNNTLEGDLGEGKIQGVISETIGTDILEAKSYVGEGTEPIIFRPGDSYQIYQPRQFVVESVSSETQLTTDNYTSATDPDFDNGEYYRVMPAANTQTARVDAEFESGGIAYLDDSSASFVDDGIELGDIVENDVGAFGEIVFLTNTRIGATLYGGSFQDFWVGAAYTVFYDYVYSREHTLRAKFSGNQGARAASEERVRDVCLGYNADCSTVSAAVNFSGNGGEALITINDYQEDEVTNVGTATFTPTNLSSGNLLVSNIDFGLSVTNSDIPAWVTNNDWHKLVYVAVSPGDAPGAVVNCAAAANCLTLNYVQPETPLNIETQTPLGTVRALVMLAGSETNKILDSNCAAQASTTQIRTNGTMNEYFESDNCDQDDMFQEETGADDYNDQVLILATSP
ncbi:MAG: hypothetical protein HND53_08105 [Proteobacteria bacterium]|nr:hypothetical protein [Pseudomonadota bacterium]NOG60445.1 hypothetical protein [Pseudomonadota bacterium]